MLFQSLLILFTLAGQALAAPSFKSNTVAAASPTSTVAPASPDPLLTTSPPGGEDLVTGTQGGSKTTTAATTPAVTTTAAATPAAASSADGPMVFVHYMVGNYPANGDYATDIATAAKAGADAMALNFGGWGNSFEYLAGSDSPNGADLAASNSLWEGWLDEIYAAAEPTSMKLFISFDMTSVTDPAMVSGITLKYAQSSAQLYWKDKLVISSFSNDDTYSFSWQKDILDVINAKLSAPALFLPGSTNPNPTKLYGTAYPEADGIFYWPSYSASVSLQETFDADFFNERDSSGKLLMIGISPWFSKHLSADMNWGNNQGSSLFLDRFERMLIDKPDFIELVTLNDFGESSNLKPQPPSSNIYSQYYYANLAHTGFLGMAGILSAAFKAGQETVSVTEDKAFVQYRTQSWKTKGSQDSIGVPTDSSEDDVLSVITFLTAPADVVVVNGANTHTFTAPAGTNKQEYPFTTGTVKITVSRSGTELVMKEGPAIVNNPTLWNGNAVCI